MFLVHTSILLSWLDAGLSCNKRRTLLLRNALVVLYVCVSTFCDFPHHNKSWQRHVQIIIMVFNFLFFFLEYFITYFQNKSLSLLNFMLNRLLSIKRAVASLYWRKKTGSHSLWLVQCMRGRTERFRSKMPIETPATACTDRIHCFFTVLIITSSSGWIFRSQWYMFI